MVSWKIYYPDGVEFSSEDGGPEDAPAHGVLVICMSDPDNGRRFQCSSDYYIWAKDEWWGVDRGGLYTYSVEEGIIKFDEFYRPSVLHPSAGWVEVGDLGVFEYLARRGNVKFGKTVRTESFNESIKKADQDPFFAPRTGWKRNEYRLDE